MGLWSNLASQYARNDYGVSDFGLDYEGEALTKQQAEQNWKDLVGEDESVYKAASVLQSQLEWIHGMLEDWDYSGVPENHKVIKGLKTCFLAIVPLMTILGDND